MTNFHLHDERTVKGLRKIAWASVFHFSFAMSPCPCPCLQVSSMSPFLHVFMSHVYVSVFQCLLLHVYMPLDLHVSMPPSPYLRVSGIPQMENCNFVCCKQKMETANFCFFAASGNEKIKFFPWSANDKQ
jgi:hypothetical protein